MQEPAIVDLYVPAGDTFQQPFKLLEGGVPVDLTGSTVAAAVRSLRTGAEVPLAVTVGPDDGVFTLLWDAVEQPLYGRYRYDVEITTGLVVRTWIKGRFYVERDVTHAAA